MDHGSPTPPPSPPAAGFRPVGAEESARANRAWWDAAAQDYLAEHGADLTGFLWGPEGLREDDARLLGEVRGRTVLEVGAGAAQCSAWVAERGARVIATDLSAGMLSARAQGHTVEGHTAEGPAMVQADARLLPLAKACVDIAFSSYGVIPFVADPELVFAEVARVLRPGGRWVFSTPHPIRWAFPDDPGEAGLTATRSYFDTTPYAETGPDGTLHYAEHHRTLGQRVRDLTTAGFEILDVVEPTWTPGRTIVWGGWSPLRGALLPGTAVFVSTRAA